MTASMPRHMGLYVLDEHGEPLAALDVISWAEWLMAHPHDRQIALDQAGPFSISTVFLGVSTRSALTGQPAELFETRIFGSDEDATPCWRYDTREEAQAGHAARIRETLASFGDQHHED